MMQTTPMVSAARCSVPNPARVSKHLPTRRDNVRCNSTPKWKRTPQSMSGPDPDQGSGQPGQTPFSVSGSGMDSGGVYQPPSSRDARKIGSPGSQDSGQSPDAVAKRQRERVAEAAAADLERVGQDLGSSAGEVTKDVETLLAAGQGQVANAAADAAGGYQRGATQFERSAAETAASASAAAADTRAGRQEDAARVEGAVARGADQASSTLADGIRSVPTAADAVRGVGDGAVGALRGISQAGNQVSSAADELQRGADSLASDVQRNTETTSQEIQDRFNKASAKAEATARDLREGTTKKRGKSLLSETARLTSISAGGKDDIDGLKTKLLASVAGLDRGFAAGKRQIEEVKDVVNELIAASDPVNLMPQSSTPASTTPGVTITTGAPPIAAYGAPAPQSQQPMPPRVMAPGVSAPGIPAPGGISSTPPSAADGFGASDAPKLMLPRVMAPGVSAPGVPPPGVTTPGVSTPGGSAPAYLPGVATPNLSSSPPGPAAMGQRSMGGPNYGISSGMPDASSDNKSSSQNSELGGLWRLVYSSGFARRNTGGARPGLPINLFPAQFGQIYQDINTTTNRLDNVVELRRPALPAPSWAPIKPLPAEALLTLKHRLSITAPATVTITFTGTDVNLQGGLGGILNAVPQFELPNLPQQLQLPRKSRSASFEVVYLDEDIRITHGDRKELRVFLRT